MLKLLNSLFVISAFFSTVSFADQIQARNCEVFIKSLTLTPSSHGIKALEVKIQTRNLRYDEFVIKAGFYGNKIFHDLGNLPACHLNGSLGSAVMNVYEVSSSNPNIPGEYSVQFPIASGSVVDACPGFTVSSKVTFFIETNRNTYWINPNFDSNQYFSFDLEHFTVWMNSIGAFRTVSTDSGVLSDLNPGNCR
jgi:hypothetical protein